MGHRRSSLTNCLPTSRLAQQLLAAGEHVVDIPATLASRVRLLGTGRSDKNDPNDARSVAIAALRAAPRAPMFALVAANRVTERAVG